MPSPRNSLCIEPRLVPSAAAISSSDGMPIDARIKSSSRSLMERVFVRTARKSSHCMKNISLTVLEHILWATWYRQRDYEFRPSPAVSV
jgi:hypothetical protein